MTASSSTFRAVRASPSAVPARKARASSSASAFQPPRPRSGSASAWRRTRRSSSPPSGFRTTTRERESSAPLTSNDGFSVVAPMRTMSPDSTWARRASCCPLLNRWISSMKTTVRRPSRRRRSSAARRTSRTSFTPDRTALIASKWAFVRRRITKARVVLPEPGGPQRMSERSWSCSIARRRGRPGPSTSSWPRISSSVRGRTRSASGASGRGSPTGIWWSRPPESRSSGKSDPVSSPRGRAALIPAPRGSRAAAPPRTARGRRRRRR